MAGKHEENLELFGDEQLPDQLLKHLPDISDGSRKKWPRDLLNLIDIFAAALQRLGYDENESQRISNLLLAELSTYCGGRHIYLPKNDALKSAIRDVCLFRDWSDRNIMPDELSKKYHISVQHAYRVINEQRGYHMNRVQPSLPGL